MQALQKILLCGFIASCMLFCSPKQTVTGVKLARKNVVKYINGYQELSVNNLTKAGQFLDTIKVLSSAGDTLDAGKGYKIKVFLSNPEVKVAYAYWNADINARSLVDTASATVNISKGAVFRIVNDSVQVNITVSELQPGPKEFGMITVISVDKEKVFRFHNGYIRYFSRKR